MPFMGVPEMDAVSALLELRCDFRDSRGDDRQRFQQSQPNSTSPTAMPVRRLNINLDVTRVTSTPSNRSSPSPGSPTVVKLPNGGGYIIRNNLSTRSPQSEQKSRKRLNLHKKYQQEQRRWSEEHKLIKKSEKTTCEIGTQTELEYQCPQYANMQDVITKLCSRINILERQLEKTTSSDNNDKAANDSPVQEECSANETYRRKYVRKVKTNSSSTATTVPSEDFSSNEDSDFKIEEEDKDEDMSDDDDDLSDDTCNKNKIIPRNNFESKDLTPIGLGNAFVPSRLLNQLEWNSYTNATRKLLIAVFPRRVLATHSLTGKRSPAFPDKPAKKKLDPALVNDIILTVCERCKVPENVVRTSITTKCADESKMLRSRQRNKLQRRLSKKENEPPRPSVSERTES